MAGSTRLLVSWFLVMKLPLATFFQVSLVTLFMPASIWAGVDGGPDCCVSPFLCRDPSAQKLNLVALSDERTASLLLMACRLSNAADKIPARPPLRPAAAARPEGAPPSYEQAMQMQPAASGQLRGNGSALGRSAEEILAIQVGCPTSCELSINLPP